MINPKVQIFLLLLFNSCALYAQLNPLAEFESKKKILYKDKFNKNSKNWIIETSQSNKPNITVQNGKLTIDVNAGATVWFNKKLSGNILIEFTRKVVMENGKNDRLSDLNVFWMAQDPRNKNLFTRNGKFDEYDSLQLYYVGVGGNHNTTTRFRKYEGNGNRTLHGEHLNKEHLLEPNKIYHIQILVLNGTCRFFVDNKEFFSFQDPEPLTNGYFGFRTTQSRQEVDNFIIYQLKE